MSVEPQTRPRRSQSERRERSKRLLLEAAGRLVVERGFEGVTVDGVAAEAGYSRGIVRHFFGSKDGLMQALVTETVNVWRDQTLLPAVGGASGVEAICTTVDALLGELVHRTPRLHAYLVLHRDAASSQARLRELFRGMDRRNRRQIARWIRDGQQRGEIRADIDPDAQATFYLAWLRGVFVEWLLDPEGTDAGRLFDLFKASVRRDLEVRGEDVADLDSPAGETAAGF